MKQLDLIKILEQHGFCLIRNSSHKIYHRARSENRDSVSVAVPHGRMLNGRTAFFILKKAGIRLGSF